MTTLDRSTPATSTSIALEGVNVELGGKKILEDISLSIEHGEFIALVGASGGGKSTLLRVIAGLIPAKSGKVRVADAPAFVFQDYRLLPWRTALGNVKLPRQIQKQPRGLEPAEALKQTGMQDFGAFYPYQLSGGMRARVAIARALAQSSDIMLMDEPFAALDALVRERFNVELKHLHDKSGRTTVFVTHSIREAVFLADRVVVLKNGRLEAVVDTRAEGRITAYTDGLEARLRDLLGQGDSTRVQGGAVRKAIPWELWASLALIVVVLLIWQGVAVQMANPFLLPSPLEVMTSLVQNFKMLFAALLVTLETALTGLFFGALIGTVLGYVLGRFVWLERILSPFLIASQNTPTVILAPLLLNYLGFTFLPGVIVTVIICFYPILVSTTVGLREVEREYQELFRTLGASSWQRLKLLELPGALPVVLGGLRLGVNLSLIGSVVWEFVNPNVQGIGLAVTQAQVHYHMETAFAAVFLLILSGCAGYGLLTWLERLALRHRRQN